MQELNPMQNNRQPLNFETVWRMFQETDRKFQETDRKFQETDRKFQETREQMMKDTDYEIKESGRQIKENLDRIIRENAKGMEELRKTVGRVTNTLGDVVEGFMSSDIHLLFKKYGYSFNITSQNKVFRDKDNRFLAEVDAFLENGDYVMLVEIKSRLRSEDITEQIERLQTIREIFDKRGDKRKLLGSIASPKINESQLATIRKRGLYAIIPYENDVKVYPEEADFKAKEW
ncbi:MAG: hypothetical protein LBG17_06220 [Bacteroidales bacterium]|jgi:molybdopterin converting factor small subunit|nr:hypothetical protein [Bacteroidales bacterium]